MSQEKQSPIGLRVYRTPVYKKPPTIVTNSTVPVIIMKSATDGGHKQIPASPTEDVSIAERKRAIISRPKKLTNAKKAKKTDIESDDDFPGLLNESCSSEMENTVDYFERINPRLAAYGNTSKYVITTKEIERRANGPEHLNSSALAGLLRRSKVKNCGEDMRNKLKQHGIEVDLCKRKGSRSTTLTGMCERELHDVALDLDQITKESFPSSEIADCILKKAKTTEEQKKIVEEARDFIEILAHLLYATNSSQPPISGVPEVESYDKELHNNMKNYSLHTHGFGTFNHKTWSQELLKIGTELCNFVPRKAGSSDVKK